MNVNIVSVVWGKETIHNFINYSLPSFDYKKQIFTNPDFNLTIFTKAADFKYFESIHTKNVIFEFIDEDNFEKFSPIEIHNKIWINFSKKHSESDSLIFYLPPDTVWSKDSLEIIVNDVKKDDIDFGYIHYYRVEEKEFLSQLKNASNILPNKLYDIASNYTHNIHKSHYIDSSNFTIWPEYITAKTGKNEYNLVFSKEPLFSKSHIDLQLLKNNIVFKKMKYHVYGSTNNIFCVSLTEKYKDPHWYQEKNEFDINKIANWLVRYDYHKDYYKFMDNFIEFTSYSKSQKEKNIELLQTLEISYKKIIFNVSALILSKELANEERFFDANLILFYIHNNFELIFNGSFKKKKKALIFSKNNNDHLPLNENVNDILFKINNDINNLFFMENENFQRLNNSTYIDKNGKKLFKIVETSCFIFYGYKSIKKYKI